MHCAAERFSKSQPLNRYIVVVHSCVSKCADVHYFQVCDGLLVVLGADSMLAIMKGHTARFRPDLNFCLEQTRAAENPSGMVYIASSYLLLIHITSFMDNRGAKAQ